jgi:hypothetical protein
MHRMPSPAAVLLDLPKLAMATSERSIPSTPGEKMGEAAEGADGQRPYSREVIANAYSQMKMERLRGK